MGLPIFVICLKENHLKLKSITLNLFICCFFFAYLSVYFLEREKIIYLSWKISLISSSTPGVSVIVDLKSSIFAASVFLIRACITYYSLSYMEGEIYLYRFILILLLFVLSILVFIFRSNLIGILIGWDGLGISSYFLVVYYQNKLSLNAGIVTAITNRLGDAGIMVILRFFLIFGYWDFPPLVITNFKMTGMLGLAFFLVASTKRAQIPFSSWLPAAMAAPTPVSSLVHSSTLVTAGIFLLIRVENILWDSDLMFLMSLIGGLTALMACGAAVFEIDFKKIIALSTLSHLGFMVALIGFFFRDVVFFHLILHAFFKALLFIGVGVVIHISADYQSFYKISAVFNTSPLVSRIIGLSLISLCGLPFLSGFFSKDLSLEGMLFFSSSFGLSSLVFLIRLSSLIYSVRILKLIIFSSTQLEPIFWSNKFISAYFYRMIPLVLISLVIGRVLKFILFLTPNFIFISCFIKLFIPVFTVVLGLVSWGGFTYFRFIYRKSYFLYSMFFLQPLILKLPSWGVFRFSTYFFREQTAWVGFHSFGVGRFWERYFFKDNFSRKNFWGLIKFVASFFLLVFVWSTP